MPTKNYKDTLNLPKTDFPQQANLVRMEPSIRERWERENLYARIVAARRDSPKGKWILHDGPPYANGDVHVGTGQNKVLKDVVVKFRTMQGYFSPYVPGWDCHGLPIEHRVVKELGEKIRSLSKPEIRRRCEEFARTYIDIQRRQFKSLGVLGDWERPYLTLDRSYEVAIIELFESLWKKGHITRRKKAIHWCLHDRTALAEAELEYKERVDPAIYVAFALANDPSVQLLIWTTTPWALPGNAAVAVHPEAEYARVQLGDHTAWIAKALVERCREVLRLGELVETKIGRDLEGWRYIHPLFGHECPVVLADYVTVEDGTGLVTTSPGHGEEDYFTGLKYNLPILSPVDDGGYFTDEAKEWKGLQVFEANPKLVEYLRKRGTLLHDEPFTHDYPCCWRCKNPVMFRATEQWFVSIDVQDGRARALQAVKETQWVPAWGATRMSSMLEQRPDWCISRQRSWGVPIPAFYCARCGAVHVSNRSLAGVKELFARGGADAWFVTEANDILPPDVRCEKCGGGEFRKEQDIFDVWFESAASHRAVSMKHPDLHFPAELYLEGTDQHRGWFQVSLLASILSEGRAPFREVLTHGFLNDARTGEKLSKSGYLITADEIATKHGADLMRLWICSIDFTDDIPFDPQRTLQERAEPYKKIRNTFRYMLGNVWDFDPTKDAVPYESLEKLDQWILAEKESLIDKVTGYYDDYQFSRATKQLMDFCVITLSSIYFDCLKDRLYTSGKTTRERRSAQTALYKMLVDLLKMFAPILSHTCEEAWQYLPRPLEADSVHLALWPYRPHEAEAPRESHDPEASNVREGFEKLLQVREEVNWYLENLRTKGDIGKSTEASLTLVITDPGLRTLLQSIRLEEWFIVSEVGIRNQFDGSAVPAGGVHGPPRLYSIQGLERILVAKAPHPRCERCWNFRASVGQDSAHPTLCRRCVDALLQ